MSFDASSARISRLIDEVAHRLKMPPVSYGGRASTPAADYCLWSHKIYVTPKVEAALTDYQLSCLLAHEMGHAHTRIRLVISLLLGLLTRVGLTLTVGVAFAAGGIRLGGLAGLGAWWVFRSANHQLRLWEETSADAFGIAFAGGPCEYREVLQAVVTLLNWKPNKLFRARMSRLGG